MESPLRVLSCTLDSVVLRNASKALVVCFVFFPSSKTRVVTGQASSKVRLRRRSGFVTKSGLVKGPEWSKGAVFIYFSPRVAPLLGAKQGCSRALFVLVPKPAGPFKAEYRAEIHANPVGRPTSHDPGNE